MSDHDQITRKAELIRSKFKDYLDDANNSQARQVQGDIEGLVSDAKGKKSRETIENRLRNIISGLERLEDEAMDFRHSDQIKGMCEDLRRDTAKL
jgi:hypothetical protein